MIIPHIVKKRLTKALEEFIFSVIFADSIKLRNLSWFLYQNSLEFVVFSMTSLLLLVKNDLNLLISSISSWFIYSVRKLEIDKSCSKKKVLWHMRDGVTVLKLWRLFVKRLSIHDFHAHAFKPYTTFKIEAVFFLNNFLDASP